MKIKVEKDTREKKGFEVFSFTDKVSKRTKYIVGYCVQRSVFVNKKLSFVKLCVYIKHKKDVVAALTCTIIDWNGFFNADVIKELKKDFIRNHNDFRVSEIEDKLAICGLDKYNFDDLLRYDRDYGFDNGLVIVDNLWVDSRFRLNGYARSLFRFLEKKYDGDICYAIWINPKKPKKSDMDIPNRKILPDSFNAFFEDDSHSHLLKLQNHNVLKSILGSRYLINNFGDFSIVFSKDLNNFIQECCLPF